MNVDRVALLVLVVTIKVFVICIVLLDSIYCEMRSGIIYLYVMLHFR